MKQANKYAYDTNGNLTKDLNKGITGILYNYLNLPTVVTFSDGSTITYTYGADGTKLKTVRKTGSTTTAMDSSMLPVNCQCCRPPTRTATPPINLPTNWVAGYCNAVSAPTGTTTPTMCTTTAAISALFFPRAFRGK